MRLMNQDTGILTPVSYTHLDVYKRQGRTQGIFDQEGRVVVPVDDVDLLAS